METGKILSTICTETNITINDLMSKSHKHKIVIARHLAYFIMHEKFGYTNPQIAEIFNNSVRYTIIARNDVAFFLDRKDKEYCHYYGKIKKKLKF